MMWVRKDVCGCCHAEYFIDENNKWQLVETRRIADLEAENEKFRNAVWEALDGLYGGNGEEEKLPIELLSEDRQQLFHTVLELIGETAGG